MNRSGTDNHLPVWRSNLFLLGFSLILVGFLFKLFTMQIIQGKEWTQKANDNRTAEVSLPAERGVIYDRNGVVLAKNIPTYNILITPAYLPDDEGEIQEIYRQLSKLLDVPINQGANTDPLISCEPGLGIAQMVYIGRSIAPFRPVKVKCGVDKHIAMIVKEKMVDWQGVDVEVEPIRDYPTGSLTASIIGYMGPIPSVNLSYYEERGLDPNRDKVGYAGIERSFQDELSGTNGKVTREVDVAGRLMENLVPPVMPIPGNNYYLTIDTRLQMAAEAALIREINVWNILFNEIRITSGVVIAINPKTGEILAMVSYPSFENNRFAQYIPAYYIKQLYADATNPLLNHAVGAELPVGSVFKLVTAIGALNEAVVTPEQIIQTPGKITLTEKYYANDPGNPREFVDWNFEKGGFGQLDFLGGLSNSSNVYFYKVGGGYKDEVPVGLGICRLGSYARALGYGDYTNVDLPFQAKGLIPDPTWKRIYQAENWSTGNTYLASVGQDLILATPLQVLMSAATIANDGKYMQPTILHHISDSNGNPLTFFTPEMKWDITKDPMITIYDDPAGPGGCENKETGKKRTVESWVIEKVQQGMRMAVTNGTLKKEFQNVVSIAVAGKTGTAEYCDQIAQAKNLCIPGNWPDHAWTIGYAPYEDPEIAVVAFLYNGGEGASVAGPVVRKVIEAYFGLKAVDADLGFP